MTGVYANQQWVFIAIIFFGIIAYIAFIRWRDRKWIENRFRGQKVLAMSFGVNYFGRASEPGKPRSSSGKLRHSVRPPACNPANGRSRPRQKATISKIAATMARIIVVVSIELLPLRFELIIVAPLPVSVEWC